MHHSPDYYWLCIGLPPVSPPVSPECAIWPVYHGKPNMIASGSDIAMRWEIWEMVYFFQGHGKAYNEHIIGI